MRIGLLTPAIGSRNSGDALIESAIRRLVPANEFRRFGIRTRLGDGDLAALNECDAAILCGSNLYQDHPQCVLDSVFADLLKIPLIPLGVGTSAPPGELPAVDSAQAETIRALHRRCASSGVRDPATLAFVRALGIENAKLTGCPVLFHGLVRPHFEMGEGPPTVSLRQTFLHGAESLEFKQEPLLEDLCRTHRPLLVCQGPSDLPQARRLARRHGLDFVHDDEWGCDIHEWLAGRQAWTAGFRLHHGMLALSHGRPAWFVSHDSRIDEFAKMLGLPAPDIREATPMDLGACGKPEALEGFAHVPGRWESLAAEMEEVLKANGLPCALGEARPEKPKLLFVVPRRDWAYDFSAKSIQKRIHPRYDVRIRYSTDRPKLRPEPYDLAVVFYWAETAHLDCGFDPNRVVKIVSSHRWEHSGKHGPLTPKEFAGRYLADTGTVLTTSERLQALIKDVHPRVRHTPNGFEGESFHPQRERAGSLRIGAAGWSGDAVKGYAEVLLPAVEGMDFKLADGSFPHDQMNAFYNEIDVLAVTSAHEGEPLTLIESMAAGCFPVCTDVGIVPELIRNGENGLIVRERSVAAFREAFEWCRSHLDQVREAGRKNAEMIALARSWENVVRGFEVQFEDALRFAGQPRFQMAGDETRFPESVERTRALLRWFRQSHCDLAGSTGSFPARELAADVNRTRLEQGGWRMQPGVVYEVKMDSSGPVGLGWKGLESALKEALLPRPEPRYPVIWRIFSALRRRLGFSDGGGRW